MAEEKKTEEKKASTTSTNSVKDGVLIKSVGPSNKESGVEILRFYPEDRRKKSMDIQSGQILRVGTDITSDEANRLFELKNWEFERVDK